VPRDVSTNVERFCRHRLARQVDMPKHECFLRDVSVKRTGPSAVRISWVATSDGEGLTIYAGSTPESMDRSRPLARVQGQNQAELNGLDPSQRYYFELVSDRGNRLVAAERRVPLEGAVNLRDLGGYETQNGRRLRWGQLFRSDSLARVTKGDLEFLRRMNIRLVCDLRTSGEVERAPNQFPDSRRTGYVHLAMRQGRLDPTDANERLQQGDASWLSEDYMVHGYLWNSEKYALVWKRFFNLLVTTKNRPAVFHCTAGKDRTGVAAALLLLALGVPEDTVVADYGISNVCLAPVMENVRKTIQSFGVDAQDVQPWLSAPETRIRALLDYLHQTYGSPLDYLRERVELTDAFLERLTSELLE